MMLSRAPCDLRGGTGAPPSPGKGWEPGRLGWGELLASAGKHGATPVHKTLHFVHTSGSPSQQTLQGPGSTELRFQTGPRSRAPSEPRDSDSAHCLGPSCYPDALRATGAGDVVKRVGVPAVGSRSGDCCPPFRPDGASAALEDELKPTVSFFLS